VGNGDGTFAAPAPYGVASGLTGQIQFMLLGDFNNDGKLDIFVAYTDSQFFPPSNLYSIFFGNGDGTFSSNSADFLAPVSRGVAVDVNRDGNLDIVGVCTNPSTGIQSICVLFGDGAGHFTPSTVFSTPSTYNLDHLAVGDFNRDGKLDIVYSGE